MNRLALAAAIVVAVTSSAFAEYPLQGPQLTGIALQSIQSNRLVVTTMTLPSGETVDLRQQATH